MVHLVKGEIKIDCPCGYMVEITGPAGEVQCPRCNDTLLYNTRMTNSRFGQLKKKAWEKHNGRPHRGGKPVKWIFTPEMDQEITERYDSRGETIRALAEKFGFPYWAVQHRARKLGIARTRMHNWTADEITYLQNNIHLLNLITLARNLGRTATAVKLKAKRLKICKTREGYTARGLGLALGVDSHKVKGWVDKGWLRGRRRGIEREDRLDIWYFTAPDVRDFLINHPFEIHLRPVEPITFIEILTGVQINDKPGDPRAINQREAS